MRRLVVNPESAAVASRPPRDGNRERRHRNRPHRRGRGVSSVPRYGRGATRRAASARAAAPRLRGAPAETLKEARTA
jgi:hypothetical protein